MRGEPLTGSPLAFNHPPAGEHFCYAKVLLQKENTILTDGVFFLEQGTGIEPALTAWEAAVIPIYQPCERCYYSRSARVLQPQFLSKRMISLLWA